MKTKKKTIRARVSRVQRHTHETQIDLELNIDGQGKSRISTGLKFLDHMLELFSKHGLFDLKLSARGDLDVDSHHTNEDVGIVLGRAFKEALGERKGITRYGSFFIPMDEALSRVRVALDISGRPSLYWTVPKGVNQYYTYKHYSIHDTRELLRAFVLHAGINMHVDVLKGDDPHHILEAIFKAWARAMDQATRRDERVKGVPSTKGTLDA